MNNPSFQQHNKTSQTFVNKQGTILRNVNKLNYCNTVKKIATFMVIQIHVIYNKYSLQLTCKMFCCLLPRRCVVTPGRLRVLILRAPQGDYSMIPGQSWWLRNCFRTFSLGHSNIFKPASHFPKAICEQSLLLVILSHPSLSEIVLRKVKNIQ